MALLFYLILFSCFFVFFLLFCTRKKLVAGPGGVTIRLSSIQTRRHFNGSWYVIWWSGLSNPSTVLVSTLSTLASLIIDSV